MKRILHVFLLLASVPLFAQDWSQWGYDTKHTSAVPYTAQALNHNLVNKVYDTLTQQEMAEAGALYGEPVLLAHFMTPLIDGDNVYMMCKTGTYSNRNYATQKWGVMRLHWENGKLVELFDIPSGWNAPGSAYDFWEPVFHPVLANGYLYVPSAGGSILKVDKLTGITVARINPFPTDDGGLKGTIFVLSPITADKAGNLYYNAMQFTDANNVYQNDVVDSWLVKVDKFDHYTAVSYSTLTTGAPKGTDLCENAFSTSQLPWPPSATAQPGKVTCGTQRPGFNIAPAIADDGTIYVATRAHLLSRETFLLAVDGKTLTQKWMSSLRNRFHDGCNVPVSAGGTMPPNGAPGGCTVYGITGADPATNKPGGGRILDDQSSTVTIAPDGSLFFGAYTRYNYAQGHLMHFDATGKYLGAYKFGWDITAGILTTSTGWSVLTKDNHYGMTGSYCNDETYCPSDNSFRPPDYPEAYFLTNLDPKTMTPIWSFKSTNTDSCSRDANDQVTCTFTNPNGFEWCVNAWVVDATGVSIANSEDGWLYALNPDGTLRGKIFQQLALGAAYTPTSIGADGKVYSQNAGHLFVAGN